MSDVKSKIKTTGELREMLIDTIQQVREGSLEPTSARTIAALSTTVLASAKLDLDYLRFHAAHESLGDAGKRVLDLIPLSA
jgi:hypothetical protein